MGIDLGLGHGTNVVGNGTIGLWSILTNHQWLMRHHVYNHFDVN
jgi:hypothetical protein